MLAMKRDPDKTTAAGFENKKSFVRSDGSEVLYGNDWTLRKAQLWRRCGGRCEQRGFLNGPWRCAEQADDPHHIVRRSVKRDDRLQGLLALCRFHHGLLDPRKLRWTKKSEIEA